MTRADAKLSAETVERVARLARLSLERDQVEQLRAELGAILGYVEELRELDLKGVEPLTHPLQVSAPLGADEPSAPMWREEFLAMAPERDGPFLAVPKVIGGDS